MIFDLKAKDLTMFRVLYFSNQLRAEKLTYRFPAILSYSPRIQKFKTFK